MDKQRIESLYREYVVEPGLERTALIEEVRGQFSGSPTLLYPGSLIHVTPSFYFQHAVYVDRSDFSRAFFAEEKAVLYLINGKRKYRQLCHLRFIAEDLTEKLPLPENSFDLLLSLYTGNIAENCTRYLKPGGMLLTDNHHGDAVRAAQLTDFELKAIVEECRGKVHFKEDDLHRRLTALKEPSERRFAKAETDMKTYYLFRKRLKIPGSS